jgi:hypothetical protein
MYTYCNIIDICFDQVRAQLIHKEFRLQKFDSLETRFGEAATILQQENPSIQGMKRIRLLCIIARFSGNIDDVRQFLQKVNERRAKRDNRQLRAPKEDHEELRTKYARQLAELETAGIHTQRPCVLRQLEKHQGNVEQVGQQSNRMKTT